MKKNRRIVFMVAFGLLITILVGINAHRTIRQLIKANSWEVHTHLVLNKMQRVQALLTNLDNDLRGHLLSKNPYFKAEFNRNAREMTEQLSALHKLTFDNPVQKNRIESLEKLYQNKLIRSASLFKEGNIADGKAHLDSLEQYMAISTNFSQVLKLAESYEEVLLEARTKHNERSASYATLSSLVGSIMALAMIMWAIYLLFQTIQESNQLNKQLAESEQQTKKLLDAVPVSIIIVNQKGEFYYANGAASRLFDNIDQIDSYSDATRSFDIFRYPGGEPYPYEERPTYRALHGVASQADDLEMRVNGKAIQVLTSSSPVYDADGNVQYVITSSIDISDRVQSQQRLQEAKELAEKTAKLKENFLANMSHEIRTPLNAIIGFSELLDNTSLDNDQKEFVGLLRTASKNLLTIVNDILDLSKIEAGMIKLESIPFSLYLLTSSIKTMFQAPAADKELKLLTKIDSTLPPVLLGDPTRLTQILLNLLNNAIKFTREGSISLSIEKLAETDDSVQVRFIVEDTGIGIEADVLPHIFERFRQANDFTTRFYGGTGLGLNIVKTLTELQGGTVAVESTVGKGSRFMIEITYQIAEEQFGEKLTKFTADQLSADREIHVLVVEDNLINQKLILQVLKRLGHRAYMAENGQKALDMLQENTFDIILMDIQMPVMDGYETTRHIRTKLKSSIPIIAMTAHALASEREECLKTGMNDFLPKPFQVDELQRLIHKYIPNGGSEAQGTSLNKQVAEPVTSFSIDSLMSAVGDDRELASELLEIYLSETPEELEKVQLALDQGDTDTVGRLIHTQKVHTKMLGMSEATRLILEAETRIRAKHDIAEIRPLVEQYIAEVKAILPAITQTLNGISNPTA
ncbi:response regulator [Spirosoma sp. KNUC1025]|uniref:response regulator n=1 Tax=Spirosoma sp. KNUC1025 TaxID=2894082 RepID=UPI003865EB44|nr:response regulator [Spirosoma sp. KNUC1025]